MRGESMKDKSKKSTYSTTFGVDPKNNLRPHEESNLDLAFRKRPFYPLNYRGGENLIMRKHNAD